MEIEAKEQSKRKLWKVVVGWILLIWGIIGVASNLLIWLPSGTNLGMMVLNSGVCLLFIYGGWKLIRNKG